MTPFGGVGERQKWIRGKCHSTNIRDHPRKRQREGDAVAPRHALWKELDLPCGGLVLSRTRSARSPRRSDLSRSDQERRCLAGREARWADYPRAGPRARGQPRAAARRERAVLTPRRARGRRAGRTCPRRRRGGNTMDCLRAAWTLELEWNPQPAWDPERTPWAPVSRRLAHGTAPGRGNLDIDTHEEYHVTTAAEIGIILPQAKDAKDCWQSAEVRRKGWICGSKWSPKGHYGIGESSAFPWKALYLHLPMEPVVVSLHSSRTAWHPPEASLTWEREEKRGQERAQEKW
ncbi:uncharacterized protein [Saccopteryx bilineata]|uniref:uncharacterized protein isoform X3 n=1 Tax=Saccopteryx bilineata TaxID=59482 RepID=UPI00338D3FF6